MIMIIYIVKIVHVYRADIQSKFKIRKMHHKIGADNQLIDVDLIYILFFFFCEINTPSINK